MNLPNKITLFRIIMLPVFLTTGILALYGIPYRYFVSIALFVIAAVSDYFDGHIARKYNLVTNLGKFMDPIADKLLCTTGFLLLILGIAEAPIIPAPYGLIAFFIMLLRDYAITGLRQIAQLKGCIIAADKLGKIKANFQYVSIVFGFLIGGLNQFDVIKNHVVMTYVNYLFYAVVAITTMLVLISGIMYLVKNAHVFKEDDPNNNSNNDKKEKSIDLDKKQIKNTNKGTK